MHNVELTMPTIVLRLERWGARAVNFPEAGYARGIDPRVDRGIAYIMYYFIASSYPKAISIILVCVQLKLTLASTL